MTHYRVATLTGAPRLFGLTAVLVFALALLLVAGCGGPPSPRFDRLPRPITTEQIAATLLESAPNWPLIDQAHDAYLLAFDELRVRMLAPLALRVLDKADRAWTEDPVQLEQLARAHRSALAAIAALDDSLLAEIGRLASEHSSQVARLADLRVIERSQSVIAQHDEAGVINLERLLRDIDVTEDESDRLEPFLIDYRKRLARAAASLADADLRELELRAQAMRGEGLNEAALAAMTDEGGERQKLAAAIRHRVEEASRRDINAAIDALAELNESAQRTFAAILTPSRANELDTLVGRRCTETRAQSDQSRFMADIAWEMPQVQSPAESPTRQALSRFIAADVAYRSALMVAQRLERADRKQNQAAAEATPPTALIDARARAWSKAVAQLTRTLSQEGFAQLTATAVVGDTPMRARLVPLVGEPAAARLARVSPTGLVTPKREPAQPAAPEGSSISAQFFHRPVLDSPTHSMLQLLWDVSPQDRAAFALLLEEANQRRDSRWAVSEIELLRLEDRVREIESDPTQIDLLVGSYIAQLKLAIADDAASDDLLADELAKWRSSATDDHRPAVTRLILAAGRANIPWRRFGQPWIFAPLYALHYDPVAIAMECHGSEPSRAIALQLLSDSEPKWRMAWITATEAGLSALRRLVGAAANQQEHGGTEDLSRLREGRSIAAEMAVAAAPLRELSSTFLNDLQAALPAECGALVQHAAVIASMPEFIDTAPIVLEDIERMRNRAEAAGEVAAGAAIGARQDQYQRAQAAIETRLLQLLARGDSGLLPASIDDFETRRHLNAELDALTVARDEAAMRALRDAWLLLPEKLRASMRYLVDPGIAPTPEPRRITKR
ncbi:MAG: hypothetical protein EXS00_05520 [Phycisphaerales bacterium]|nr:hypothetical protein [Phycisphaerales bacterium]